jgi:hypothetical protein
MKQEQKIERIRAKCQEILELGKLRTQGLWNAGALTEYHMIYDSKYARHIARLNGLGLAEENAQFIASCAGASEAMAQSTLSLLDASFIYRDSGFLPELITASILAAWPDELL